MARIGRHIPAAMETGLSGFVCRRDTVRSPACRSGPTPRKKCLGFSSYKKLASSQALQGHKRKIYSFFKAKGEWYWWRHCSFLVS
jgi:hypothetical protein